MLGKDCELDPRLQTDQVPIKTLQMEILFGPTHEELHPDWLSVNQSQKPPLPPVS
jgi:hypothetical protein